MSQRPRSIDSGSAALCPASDSVGAECARCRKGVERFVQQLDLVVLRDEETRVGLLVRFARRQDVSLGVVLTEYPVPVGPEAL